MQVWSYHLDCRPFDKRAPVALFETVRAFYHTPWDFNSIHDTFTGGHQADAFSPNVCCFLLLFRRAIEMYTYPKNIFPSVNAFPSLLALTSQTPPPLHCARDYGPWIPTATFWCGCIRHPQGAPATKSTSCEFLERFSQAKSPRKRPRPCISRLDNETFQPLHPAFSS